MFDKTVTTASGLTVRQAKVGQYLVDYFSGAPHLVVTFEAAGAEIDRGDPSRDAWSLAYLAKRGFSVLGVKSPGDGWYRGRKIRAWFRSEALAAFLGQFERVTFTGGSMGGFAAITFSRVRPGALVVAHNPQFTLDPKVVPWDRRFPNGLRQNWQGDFADAGEAIPLARRVYITFDPFHPEDSRHAARLAGPNVVFLKMPFLGHMTPVWLRQLDLLKETTDRTLDETLTYQRFAVMIRGRRKLARYYLTAARRFRQSGFPGASELAVRRALKIEPESAEAGKLFRQIRRRRLRWLRRQPRWLRGLLEFGGAARRLFTAIFLD